MWISATTWRLVNKRVSARRYPLMDQSLIWRLVYAIEAILKKDWRWLVEESGEEVERLLGSDPSLHQEAWHQIKGWYWAVVNRAPPPAQVTLKRITVEQLDLYSYVPPLGGNTPVSVEPFPVEDLVPTKDEIEWVVKRLRNHLSVGPSGMRAEHIKGCLAESRNKDREEVVAVKK